MRGVNLVAVTAAQAGRLRWPLAGVHLETLALEAPLDLPGGAERFLCCLRGEVVIDLPGGGFWHLKPLEATTLPAGIAARVAPVGAAVLTIVQAEPNGGPA